MTISNCLAGIAVEELAPALVWYERLFGRPADARPMSEVAEWKFPTGGWVQIVADADRAGASSITLVVDDIAAELERLAIVDIRPVAKAFGDFFKTAKLRDPDGNQIVLSQPQHNTY